MTDKKHWRSEKNAKMAKYQKKVKDESAKPQSADPRKLKTHWRHKKEHAGISHGTTTSESIAKKPQAPPKVPETAKLIKYSKKQLFEMNRKEQVNLIRNLSKDKNCHIPRYEKGLVELILKLQNG